MGKGSRSRVPVEPPIMNVPGEGDDLSVPRTTVKPAFDVERYAEDVARRDSLPTVIDAAATEEARIASVLMDSTPPIVRGLGLDEPGSGEEGADAEIGVAYETVEALDPEEQLAFLRARLSPMSRVPTLSRKLTELGPVISDPKMAYVLGFIDGLLPLDTIVEVAGLPELDTLKILDRAIEQYAIHFKSSG